MNKRTRIDLWKTRRGDIMAMVVIGICFGLYFGPMIAQGRFFIFLDSAVEMFPERYAAWSAIRHGTLPLWTPLILSGYPLLSMAQIGLGYPLTCGYLFLPAHWAEEIYVLTPYLLAPAFTYAYCRYLGKSSLASLLAGLAYGYGGAMISTDIHNGLITNATMWLPLFLIAIERVRTKPFVSSWLLGTSVYVLSVLTGYGQGFLIVGLVGLAYALCSVLAGTGTKDARPAGRSRDRWRPLLLAIAAIATSAGIAAFQILETMRAQRRSIRATLTIEGLGEDSVPFLLACKSLFIPFKQHFHTVGAHVSPIALVLAACAVALAARRKDKDVRIWLWAASAIVAWFLIQGINTPVYRAFYYIPVLNKFKQPGHYSVVFTFALAILAAYGWDAVEVGWSRPALWLRSDRQRTAWAAITLALTVVLGVLFWRTAILDGSESAIWIFKILFTASAVTAIWLAAKINRSRAVLLTFLIALACFVEPFMIVTVKWWPVTKTAARLNEPTVVTRFLQQFPAQDNRIFTFTKLFSEDRNPVPLVDPQNVSMLHGLQNVAGYEPLLFQRYSRALGDVDKDSIVAPDGRMGQTIFRSDSHVLDLLNNTYVVTYSNFWPTLGRWTEKDGIKFGRTPKIDLQPGQTIAYGSIKSEGDVLAIVSALTDSGELTQGTPVATLQVTTAGDGRTIELKLRAGIDTAEWAHERPDVKPEVRHELAPIFETRPGDAENSFAALSYWSRVPLGRVESVAEVKITNTTQRATLVISGLTLYDSARSYSMPLAQQAVKIDFEKWRPVSNENGVMILKNSRAMPRAWLVAEAEAVDGEEALRRIRGSSDPQFDPRQTAMLETVPQNLSQLPGGPISPEASAHVAVYEPGRMVVDTEASTASVLVVSEMNYPGWMATVDGIPTPILAADFLLRGILLTSGKHRVEMRYTAPAARNGAMISVFTLLMMLGVGAYARRRPVKDRSPQVMD